MTKQHFMDIWDVLSAERRKELKTYFEDLHKGAVFSETLNAAEQRLLWIKEYEEERA